MRTVVKRVVGCSLIALWLSVVTASAQDRTALVVANFDYGEHQLSHIKSQAAAVGEALRREGFRVTSVENLQVKQLKTTVEEFARSTVTRGVAVFYFTGMAGQYKTYNSKGAWWNHIQAAGEPSDPRNPERDSMALREIVKQFADHSTSSTNLLVLDAAEPNPFLSERANHPLGFAAIDESELPEDMAMLLSSQPISANPTKSTLAAAFAKHLPSGRESIDKLLTLVTEEVKQKSAGAQVHSTISHQQLQTVSWKMAEAEAFLDSNEAREAEYAGQQWINSAGMMFCWCPPGKFMMGSQEPGRADFEDAEPIEVTLSSGFWMGKYEVTQMEAVRMKQSYLSAFPGKQLPLNSIQYGQAGKMISALNDAERRAGRLPDGWEYALPTEAEWEYACRAGTTSRYSFGDDESRLCRHANYADGSLFSEDEAMEFADARFNDGVGKSLAVVGSYLPNAWGLHDMHGNVAEWCRDRYLPRLIGGVDPLVNEKNQEATQAAVFRGGSWCSMAKYCEAGFRNSEYAAGNAGRRDFLGFRIVLKRK